MNGAKATWLLGIDDTDVVGSPGTNRLARRLVDALAGLASVRLILRHQLLDSPAVPYTSGNGCASLLLEPRAGVAADAVFARVVAQTVDWAPIGSDPGVCLAESPNAAATAFARRCQQAIVTQSEAHDVARAAGWLLQGLGGTCGGVIGALAAVGLLADGSDGRVLFNANSPRDYYDVAGVQSIETLGALGIDAVLQVDNREAIASGAVDVGKRLRPNRRDALVVLLVEPAGVAASGGLGPSWRAVRLD